MADTAWQHLPKSDQGVKGAVHALHHYSRLIRPDVWVQHSAVVRHNGGVGGACQVVSLHIQRGSIVDVDWPVADDRPWLTGAGALHCAKGPAAKEGRAHLAMVVCQHQLLPHTGTL